MVLPTALSLSDAATSSPEGWEHGGVGLLAIYVFIPVSLGGLAVGCVRTDRDGDWTNGYLTV